MGDSRVVVRVYHRLAVGIMGCEKKIYAIVDFEAGAIMKKKVQKLESFPIHLGLGAVAKVQPKFTGPKWYQDYIRRTKKDGIEGRLVSMFTFSEPWGSWEMHPEGSEVVVCISGKMDLIQEIKGKRKRHKLKAGQYIINPPGVWHTADADSEVTAIFITTGVGTDHRERKR